MPSEPPLTMRMVPAKIGTHLSKPRIGNIRSINSADLLYRLATIQCKHKCSIFLMTCTTNGRLKGYQTGSTLAKVSIIRQTWPAFVTLNNHRLHKIITFMRSLRTPSILAIHFIQVLKRIIWSLISGLSKILVVLLGLSSLVQNLRILVNSMKLTTAKSTKQLKSATTVKF